MHLLTFESLFLHLSVFVSTLERFDEHLCITIFPEGWRALFAMGTLCRDDVGPNFFDKLILELLDNGCHS